jgi:hypothetical protein
MHANEAYTKKRLEPQKLLSGRILGALRIFRPKVSVAIAAKGFPLKPTLTRAGAITAASDDQRR